MGNMAKIEFATRMGSLFRQQVRAPEKEKLIFGEPHANSMDAVLEKNSVGGSRYLGKLPNWQCMGFCDCVTILLNVILKMQGLW